MTFEWVFFTERINTQHKSINEKEPTGECETIRIFDSGEKADVDIGNKNIDNENKITESVLIVILAKRNDNGLILSLIISGSC